MLRLKRMCSVKEVQECLAEHSVMTLASSPDNQPVMKMFLFAQEVSLINRLCLFLVDHFCLIFCSKVTLV